MPIPAIAFSLEKAHCPACFATLTEALPACPFCHYDGAAAMQRFPLQPVPLEEIMDFEDRLSNGEKGSVRQSIRRLRRTFPQIGVMVALLKLPEGTDAREFGFWWFNSDVPRTPEETHRRHWSLLLLIDRARRCASVTTGYALEPFLGDMTLERLLAKSRPDFLTSSYAKGINRFLRAVLLRLVATAPDILHTAGKFRKRNPEPGS